MAEAKKEPCWYVIHTYSGYENKVKDTLEKSVENNGMQDLILEVRVPMEEVVEIRNGKRVKSTRKVYRKLVCRAEHPRRYRLCGPRFQTGSADAGRG